MHVVAPAASRRHGVFNEKHEGQEFTVHRLRSWRWRPHPWIRFALPWQVQANSKRILESVKPDVVHLQSHMVVGRGLSDQARKRGIRIVATNHLMPENMLEFTKVPKAFYPFLIRWVWRLAAHSFAQADAVTTPTRRAANLLEQHTPLNGVLAISCGIDTHHYVPNLEPRTENLIVFLGRVTGEKQIDKLIRAFALLDPSLEAKLEIVGGGDLEQSLKALSNSLGLGDRVTFTGYVSEEYLRGALTRATVFAMPSIAELQSIATMEAMASGLPIVAANAMALPHLVHDGENGFLFEPGNVEEFAERLTDVLTMPEEELLAFKRESLSIVEAHDIQRTLATFEALYRGEIVTDTVVDERTPIGVLAWRARIAKKLRSSTT